MRILGKFCLIIIFFVHGMSSVQSQPNPAINVTDGQCIVEQKQNEDDNKPHPFGIKSVGLNLTNDFLIPPAGLVAFIFDSDSGDVRNPFFDRGYTAGVGLSLKLYLKQKSKEDSINIDFTSDLYSGGDTGIPPEDLQNSVVKKDGTVVPKYRYHLFFTEINALKLEYTTAITNSYLERLKIEEVGIGLNLYHLNSKNPDAGIITNIQEIYHNRADIPAEPVFEYYPGPQGIRTLVSGNLKLCTSDIALFEAVFMKHKISAQIGNHPELNQLKQESEINVSINLNKKTPNPRRLIFALRETTIIYGEGGLEFVPAFLIVYEGKRLEVKNEIDFQTTQGPNYMIYNNAVGRPYTKIALIYKFKKKIK